MSHQDLASNALRRNGVVDELFLSDFVAFFRDRRVIRHGGSGDPSGSGGGGGGPGARLAVPTSNTITTVHLCADQSCVSFGFFFGGGGGGVRWAAVSEDVVRATRVVVTSHGWVDARRDEKSDGFSRRTAASPRPRFMMTHGEAKRRLAV